MKKAATYLLMCAGVLLSHHANAKNDMGSLADSYNQAFNNQIMVQRQVVEIRAQQCNYFQQTFQSNVPNWSSYRSNNEFIKWV